MYRTDVKTVPAGPFAGPLVASMRPIPRDRVITHAAGQVFVGDLRNTDLL